MSKSKIAPAGVAVALSVLFMLAVQFSLAAPTALPALQTGSDTVAVCTWLGCKSGAVSYTQDDAVNVISKSCQVRLEAAGFRGTFYYDGLVTTGSTTQTWLVTITAAGHEVGSHLTNHQLNCTIPPSCYPDCSTLEILYQTPTSPVTITNFRQDQIEPNILAIEAGTNQPVLSLAYPCGATDANRMIASEYYFLGARGYSDTWGNNFPWIVDVNPATPPEAMLLNSDNGIHDDPLIDRAISEGTWAIFAVHDACLSIGTITSRQADLWVAPVGEVLKYIKVRDAARFASYTQTYNSIGFDAGHSLSPMLRHTLANTPLLSITFDNLVTLNVEVPANKGVGAVVVDGLPVSYAISGTISSAHSVLFTTTLELTRTVAITLTGPNAVQLRDLSARSDTDLSQNLGWLLALIVMGTSGLAGLMKANRRQPHG